MLTQVQLQALLLVALETQERVELRDHMDLLSSLLRLGLKTWVAQVALGTVELVATGLELVGILPPTAAVQGVVSSMGFSAMLGHPLISPTPPEGL